MRSIAIVNQKGGSGKATTAVNMAAALGEKDRRVLVVDLDPPRPGSSGATPGAIPPPRVPDHHPGKRPPGRVSLLPRPHHPVADTEPPKQAKERMTFHLPVEVMERAKNAVYWTPCLTLADLAAQALTDTVDRLEKKKGEPHSLPGR